MKGRWTLLAGNDFCFCLAASCIDSLQPVSSACLACLAGWLFVVA